MALVFESSHPLVKQKIAELRAVETPPPSFRMLVRSLGVLLGVEATATLSTRPQVVRTPLGEANCEVIEDALAIVPILRAGLGMAEGLLDLMPEARVWHIGLFRDEHTLMPKDYYHKITNHNRIQCAFVADPMLATGGSAVRACELLQEAGVSVIKYLCLIAAPEGIQHLSSKMPDVSIHTGAIDDRLTEIGFIYPGLGDAGDRQFATAPHERNSDQHP